MGYFLIFIVTMAVLSYFQQKKAPPNSMGIEFDSPNIVNQEYQQEEYYSGFRVDDKYIEILMKRPEYSLFVDGDYSYSYTDQYKTDEGYKLRELLLLVWWGKVKKGRNINAKIPRYFYERYHINPNNVTKQFFADKFIFSDTDNIVKFTDKGLAVKDKYINLWEIHSVKRYYANLDNDFPNWNINKFLIKKHYQNIAYLKAQARWNRELLDFLRENYPKDDEQINYQQDQVIWCLNQINQLEAEIDALTV